VEMPSVTDNEPIDVCRSIDAARHAGSPSRRAR
jgi:hypothetical protein